MDSKCNVGGEDALTDPSKDKSRYAPREANENLLLAKQSLLVSVSCPVQSWRQGD